MAKYSVDMKFSLDKKDKIWEAISLLLLLVQALLIAQSLPSIPDTVPVIFNERGPDRHSESKYMLWIPFGLSVMVYAFMTFVSFRPGIYKWRMTERNVAQQYQLTSRMARTVKAFVILAFIVLTVFVLRNARGRWNDLSPLLMVILFALIVSPCLYYAVKFSKIR